MIDERENHQDISPMLALPTKHALKALLALSERGQNQGAPRGTFFTAEEIAVEAELPAPFLRKLLKQLEKESLIVTRKGRGGGVALREEPVSLYELCEVLKDPLVKEYCLLSKVPCSQLKPCPLHGKWNEERKRIHLFLKSVMV